MLIKKALITLIGAASAVQAFPSRAGKAVRDVTEHWPVSRRGPEEGGLYRFEIVKDFMSPGDLLARSSAPFYQGSDSDQRVTNETIAFFKESGIKHVISLNGEADAEHMKTALAAAGIAYTPRPVEDFHTLTPEDFQKGWESFVEHRNGTLVWCGYGHGRTGTMISGLQIQAQHERGEPLEWTASDYSKNHVETPEQRAALDDLQQRLKSASASTAAAEAPASKPPGPKEMEDALCSTAEGKPNKYSMAEDECRRQVAQCVFEIVKASNFDPVIACMDKKFLPAAAASAA
ncbi:hypothetical protein V2A60_000394 [Cordyceps javanica]